MYLALLLTSAMMGSYLKSLLLIYNIKSYLFQFNDIQSKQSHKTKDPITKNIHHTKSKIYQNNIH